MSYVTSSLVPSWLWLRKGVSKIDSRVTFMYLIVRRQKFMFWIHAATMGQDLTLCCLQFKAILTCVPRLKYNFIDSRLPFIDVKDLQNIYSYFLPFHCQSISIIFCLINRQWQKLLGTYKFHMASNDLSDTNSLKYLKILSVCSL